MTKAIIFDYYGVIRSDDYHDWLVRNGLARDIRTKHATKDLDTGDISLDEFFEKLSKFSDISADDIRKDFAAHASLNKQLINLILKLKDNYKIGLLSNAGTHIRKTLADARVDKLFDEIMVSSDIGFVKPSKEIFEYALKKLDIEASEAIFIDDSQMFVEAAQELGLKGITFRDAESLINELRKMGIIDK